MKKIGLTILFFLSAHVLFATHQKAAEITYRHVGGNLYEFTLITYTYSRSLADRPWLFVSWRGRTGGGEIFQVQRNPQTDTVGPITVRNTYRFNITFPGEGTFFISMEDPNRNGGVINIPNSINIPIFVETTLEKFSAMGSNSSPRLLNSPIDQGCVGVPFMHNPGAYDPDGDSLSFRFIPCRGANGLNIPNFRLPSASDSITINPITGDLIWASPETIGDFNIAILIEEFRNGIRIGSVTRDMQISIQHCDNRPPVLHAPEHFCVLAGDTLRIPVRATDPDPTDILTLSATGGMLPPIRNSAVFSGNTGVSPVYDTLIWVPQHSDVQQQPHPIYFRVRDNGNPNLNALRTTFVQVIGPAPELDSIVPTFDVISLYWTPISDESILGYRIYRSRSRSGITQGACDFGVTDGNYEWFVEIREDTIFRLRDSAVKFEVKGDSIFVLRDSTINQGFLYCYRIVRLYRNGAVSQMSDEFCTALLSNAPIIEKVSIVETDENFGKIKLAWRHPLDLDVVADEANFRYVIHRLNGGTWEVLDTNQIQDTIFLDTLRNTRDFYHTYKIKLIRQNGGSWSTVGFSNEATSVFIEAIGRSRRVNIEILQVSPSWSAESFDIYRKMAWQSDTAFEFITNTTLRNFTDINLMNDSTYTYKIRAIGRHFNERINDYELINWSQRTNATPTIGPPCTPDFWVELFCNPLEHRLEWWWTIGDDCDMDDSTAFHIFFSPYMTGENFSEIGKVVSGNTFINPNVFAGRYYIIASNQTADNQFFFSERSEIRYISFQQFHDECMNYEIPNVFTPNGDGINDEFKIIWHFPPLDFGIFTIRIFNRWGNLVFESNDPHFEWDGINQATGQPAPDGTYFWVIERGGGLGGEALTRQTLSGNVTLLR